MTFPDNYGSDAIKGKTAEFEVAAKSVEAPGDVTVDDEFAKSLGMESLAKLREAVKGRAQQEYATVTRRRLKRALLDQLDEHHKFDLPPTMVEEEFDNVWKTIVDDLQTQGRTFTDEGTSEDDAKAEYRKIAERRVRLGLVLSEIGEQQQHQGHRRRGQPRGGRARAPVPRAGAAGLGSLPQESRRRWRACARRCSRRRWSTSWSSSPPSPNARYRGRSCYKEDEGEDAAA